jgi:methylphosphotriester-DNA--protein-cysteine methyltransferase
VYQGPEIYYPADDLCLIVCDFCPSRERADKISAKNLLRHASRDQAIAAGKQPCQECKP